MKYTKLIILMILLFPLSVFASTQERIIVDCPEKIKKDEQFTCEISGTAPYKVCAVEYEYTLPDYIKKIDFKVDDYWQGEEENNLAILYTDENKESPYRIGKITLTSSKDIDELDIKTKYLLLGDDDYNEHIVVSRDVKDMKTDEENSFNPKQIDSKYGIIISIVVLVSMATLILIRKKVNK